LKRRKKLVLDIEKGLALGGRLIPSKSLMFLVREMGMVFLKRESPIEEGDERKGGMPSFNS